MKRNSNGISARVLVMAVALTLIIGGIIGGSVAWLTAKTDPVVNTFTVGDINIELKESGTTTVNGKETKSYTVTPGVDLTKDPKVKVMKDSEACWLFVKVEAQNWPTLHDNDGNKLIDYRIASDWTQVEGIGNVYYKKLDATKSDTEYQILSGENGGKVTVSDKLTKEMLKDLDKNFTLTFTAYAIQQDGFTTAEAAWAEVSK